jgi:hypothetical protein
VAAFLSPAELGELRTAVEASYDLLREHADDDPPTLSEYLVDHYKRWDGIWVKELRGYLERANPGLFARFEAVIAAAERRFRALFDRDWRLEPNFTFIRRHRSARKYLPWHIDADAAGIINSTDYCINTWLPLDPVGDVLPSLELIPGSNKTMREAPSREGTEKSRADEWVKANVGGESWIPRAEPGDAILFDHWTLHRTQRIERENAARTSCEFRFVRTS